jgi:hypothetical protein
VREADCPPAVVAQQGQGRQGRKARLLGNIGQRVGCSDRSGVAIFSASAMGNSQPAVDVIGGQALLLEAADVIGASQEREAPGRFVSIATLARPASSTGCAVPDDGGRCTAPAGATRREI